VADAVQELLERVSPTITAAAGGGELSRVSKKEQKWEEKECSLESKKMYFNKIMFCSIKLIKYKFYRKS